MRLTSSRLRSRDMPTVGDEEQRRVRCNVEPAFQTLGVGLLGLAFC